MLHRLPPRQKYPHAQVGRFDRAIDGKQARPAAA
jgi:hypothetical protein